jgi:hypothetical protein
MMCLVPANVYILSKYPSLENKVLSEHDECALMISFICLSSMHRILVVRLSDRGYVCDGLVDAIWFVEKGRILSRYFQPTYDRIATTSILSYIHRELGRRTEGGW